MKPFAFIHFFVLSLAACGIRQTCSSCDDDAADDNPPPDMAEEMPDLPCDGADLQNDDLNCGTCENECRSIGSGTYEVGGCVAGVCNPTWEGEAWYEPTLLTCDDVCGTSSCHTNGCAGLTGFVCESILGVECDAISSGGGAVLLDLSGACDEPIPWPDVVDGGDRVVYCCCG